MSGKDGIPSYVQQSYLYEKVTVAFVFMQVICWFSLRAADHHCICPSTTFDDVLENNNKLFNNDFFNRLSNIMDFSRNRRIIGRS